jgi:hypothetical protein
VASILAASSILIGGTHVAARVAEPLPPSSDLDCGPEVDVQLLASDVEVAP